MSSRQEKSSWYGWLILVAIVGLIIWSQMPDKPPTRQDKMTEYRQALDRTHRVCDSDMVPDRLRNACMVSHMNSEGYDYNPDYSNDTNYNSNFPQ
jgi:hypothetical protein